MESISLQDDLAPAFRMQTGARPFVPDFSTLLRLTSALVADELGSQQKRTVLPHESMAWHAGLSMDEAGLGMDSLARLDLGARLNQYFHLHEVGIEDYLLMEATLGGWVRIIERSLHEKFERLTFQTSGTSGAAKLCTHSVAGLIEEVHELAELTSGATRIFSLVPPHHIYGLLFTVLLPPVLRAPLIDARHYAPGHLMREAGPTDVVIGTPFLWSVLAKAVPSFAGAPHAVTSTAPMPPELALELRAKGLSSLTEIYGSSETAGIGWRQQAAQPFRLFRHWRRDPASDTISRADAATGLPAKFDIPDKVEWHGDDQLTPVGRRDGAVQVGGTNVFPADVETRLRQHERVADCAVRLDTRNTAAQRLKAFIVLRETAGKTMDQDAVRAALMSHMAQNLPPAARPASLTFGAALPRNTMGKLSDW
jgi:long-chain acyl-CoA synthetase